MYPELPLRSILVHGEDLTELDKDGFFSNRQQDMLASGIFLYRNDIIRDASTFLRQEGMREEEERGAGVLQYREVEEERRDQYREVEEEERRRDGEEWEQVTLFTSQNQELEEVSCSICTKPDHTTHAHNLNPDPDPAHNPPSYPYLDAYNPPIYQMFPSANCTPLGLKVKTAMCYPHVPPASAVFHILRNFNIQYHIYIFLCNIYSLCSRQFILYLKTCAVFPEIKHQVLVCQY